MGHTLIYAFDESIASILTFKVSGGSGDVDLYVKFGSVPTTTNSDFSSLRSGNNEVIIVPSPKTGK